MDYRRRAAEVISSYININAELVYNFIEVPSKEEIGDLSLPCFKLCGIVNSNPAAIARELRCNIKSEEFEKIENVGPYLNFFINKNLFVEEKIDNILNNGSGHEAGSTPAGKSICIEFLSSKRRNIFSLDEFFSIILSNALNSIFRSRGYDVSVKEFIISERTDDELIYNYISKPDIKVISNYTDRAEGIIKELESKGLIDSEKYVKFISLKKYNMAPYIIWNKDDGITNSMKILTSVLDIEVGFDNNTNIFISDSLSTYKFKQLSKVLELLGYKESNFLHVEYGNIKIQENGVLKGSTATMSVSDMLGFVVKFVESSSLLKDEELHKKSMDILIFSLLMNFRSKNITIDIKNLKFSKNEGLYYMEDICIRALEIINKSCWINNKSKHALSAQERVRITKKLIEFDNIIDISMEKLEPAYIAHYIFKLAQEIEEVFIKECSDDSEVFIWEDKDIRILKSVIHIIKTGLYLIGIKL